MIDETTPQGEQQPIKEVQIGEWFSPFPHFEELPYQVYREDDRRKHAAPHSISGIGPVDISLTWIGNEENLGTYENGDSDTVLIGLPFGTKIIKEADILKEGEGMETRLMFFNIDVQNPNKDARVYVRLPDGTEVALVGERDSNVEGPAFYGGEIRGGERDGAIVDQIAIPETAWAIEKIQIKFAPKEVKVKA